MLKDLKIKIFADGADLENIKFLSTKTYIKGLTTNPSLMRKKGVSDYKNFALEVLKVCQNKPVSFEIFADDLADMERQAIEISKWGENVNVKIPITNTKGESTKELIKVLSKRKIICNVTAILTIEQLEPIINVLDENLSDNTEQRDQIKRIVNDWADLKIKAFQDRRSWVRNPDKEKSN